jgi:ribosomal protein L9
MNTPDMRVVFDLAHKVGRAGLKLINETGYDENYLMPALLALAASCAIAKAGSADKIETAEEIAHDTLSQMLDHYKAMKFSN